MKPTSFRHDLNPPPLRYRTPSPPRAAFEPISPSSSSPVGLAFSEMRWSSNDGSYHQALPHYRSKARAQERTHSGDAMDTFASIALATTPQDLAPNHQPSSSASEARIMSVDDYRADRPVKRRRSEKQPSQVWSQSGPASSTNHGQIPESRIFEAELLLNFAQTARLSNPSSAAVNGLSSHGTNPPQMSPAAYQAKPSQTEISKSQHEMPFSTPTTQDEVHSLSARPNQTLTQGQWAEDALANKPDTIQSLLLDSSQAFHPHSGQTQALPSVQQETAPAQETLQAQSLSIEQEPQSYLTDGKPHANGVENKDTSWPEAHNNFAEGRDLENADPKNQVKNAAITSTVTPERLRFSLGDEVSLPNQHQILPGSNTEKENDLNTQEIATAATCGACKFERGSFTSEADSSSTSWINCDGCKLWFHFACAGFKSEREVRAVDKFRCRTCKPIHGSTTYVRKSSRAHTAIDYAGLNQGVIKTSDESPEHHYIRPIKDGIISFQAETFARMRPELVTAEFFEKGSGMKEPIIVPAHFNPRSQITEDSANPSINIQDRQDEEDWFSQDPEYQNVPDYGQDALDMVMPQGLTVRKVAELYGLDEKIEVIDVKSQNGEGKKWNMRRWADYYESTSNKVVRNVISLEVSQSKLGRLIRRPQIVRDLDLQDDVWPAELQAKGEFPRVQFYCLMSVADCFTDFHVDFGGSSVFYHILRGKKTFFFIPPKEKHLKKYEEWCRSPAQNWTFLGDQTKECYRVDLVEGDTMFIPAGWIHAVWTPEDSLVIGGNFLTRLNFGMQLRIAQIEKATGVARKFRYPHFQKIQWYTAIRYLEDDPLPLSVIEVLDNGAVFHRPHPTYQDLDSWGENSRAGPDNYHARYYSQAELEGLPDLTRYLLRTALIDSGGITEGITSETRNAVRKSIPRGFGEPLDIVKSFAKWTAWKRGNETIPHWAYPDAVPEVGIPETTAKLSAAAIKKLDREAALQAPRRQSDRKLMQSTPTLSDVVDKDEKLRQRNSIDEYLTEGTPQNVDTALLSARKAQSLDSDVYGQPGPSSVKLAKQRKVSSTGSQRKTACESCRKRRRACKHKSEQDSIASSNQDSLVGAQTTNNGSYETSISGDNDPRVYASTGEPTPMLSRMQLRDEASNDLQGNQIPGIPGEGVPLSTTPHQSTISTATRNPNRLPNNSGQKKPRDIFRTIVNTQPSRGRSKACSDCRKSKRRCIHDENGNEDPVKMREAAVPRPAATTKRRKLDADNQDILAPKRHRSLTLSESNVTQNVESRATLPEEMQGLAPTAVMTPQGFSSDIRPLEAPNTDSARHFMDVDESVIDPQLQNMQNEPKYASDDERCTPPAASEHRPTVLELQPDKTHESIEAEVELVPTSLSFKYPRDLRQEVGHETSFSHPAESSLVSPPASSHDDGEKMPSTSSPKFSQSSSSSRHSSQHPKTVQRFTPESGPVRRDSSNYTEEAAVNEPSTSPRSVNGHSVEPEHRRRRSRLSSANTADEESLRLIKALQMQEHGLRRRGERVS
ncbi:MAG: hypothetical protein Q9167_000298 [Letrouitia subvulpina]